MKRSAREAFSTKTMIDDSVMEITALGAGSEVGRSCILLKYKGKTIMLDCGVHPAYTGENALPLYQNINVKSIDLLLVTHFHLDHAGALPNFLEKTNFEGEVYMTHPTKAITKMILFDFIKISHSDDSTLFSEDQISNSMRKIKTLHYHEEVVHKGIKFWCYNAGHVLGAAMFMIEIDGARVLYTGDYSRQQDRHLRAAELPELRPHVLIVESTYGTQNHESPLVREETFIKAVTETVLGGGRVLLPTFALGRSQELLLILDEHWKSHPELKDIPIYFATSLGKKCMVVYQTYVDFMVDRIQKLLAYDNPFVFKHIRNLQSVDKFHDTGPCVVMASPGMLQSGLSRELFERWCSDSRNAVILSGYSVEGTLASEISKETQSQTIVSLKNHRNIPLRMKVHTMSFSAHVDYAQNSNFIKELKPDHIVLVHGATDQMRSFKKQIAEFYPKKNIHTPKNLETVHVTFELNRTCRLLDDALKVDAEADSIKEMLSKTAADNILEDEKEEDNKSVEIKTELGAADEVEPKASTDMDTGEHKVHGVLVVKNFEQTLVDMEDLHFIPGLVTTTIAQKMKVPLASVSFDDIPHHLSQLFAEMEGPLMEDDKRVILIGGTVKLIDGGKKEVYLTWNSTPIDDMVADSVVALLAHAESNPFAVTPNPASLPKEIESFNIPTYPEIERSWLGGVQSTSSSIDQLKSMVPFLQMQFDTVSIDEVAQTLTVSVDNETATFDMKTKFVTSENPKLEDRLSSLLDTIAATVLPVTV